MGFNVSLMMIATTADALRWRPEQFCIWRALARARIDYCIEKRAKRVFMYILKPESGFIQQPTTGLDADVIRFSVCVGVWAAAG